MPRTSKTSDGAASSSAAGGGEETTDGAKKRQKLTVQDKDQLRELKRRFSQDIYAMAVAYLKNTLESRQDGGQGRLLVAHHYISGKSSHVYLVFEEVTSGSEWGVLLRSPTHSNASSPMHDGKFLFKNM